MNSFKLASRSLFRKGRGNIIKIVSLGLGLAVGLVLITKVFFEYNYESFYPDTDRIYQVDKYFTVMSEPSHTDSGWYPTISGGVTYMMGRDIAQVEAATRYTYLDRKVKLLDPSRRVVEASVILADSCLHDVLPRPMSAGNAKEALSVPNSAIVSQTLAEKLGAGVGQAIEFDEYPGRSVIIAGIFEDIPENSDFRYDMAISLSSISSFMWDGSLNWLGNDRYYGFVKLFPGTTPDEITPLIRGLQEQYGYLEESLAAGFDLHYRLKPLLKVHSDDPAVRQSNLLMLLLAVSLIVIALLNYLIITLSTVIGRAKEIAVYKCYGADGGDIRRQVSAEATLHIVLSVVFAAVIVAVLANRVQDMLHTSLTALFSWQGIAIVTGVCLLLLAIATWIPSRMFVNVPAASVFRNFRRNRKAWKLALLFVQFTGAVTFMAMLAVIWQQYGMMVESDPGYKYENVVYAEVAGTTQSERNVAIENLRATSGVEMVSVAAEMPFGNLAGNNIALPSDMIELFNIADLYHVDENWLSMMEIPVIEGSGFTRGVTATDDSEMMVDRRFAERISEITGWTDGVVGKTLYVTEHGERTIVGVYENLVLGSAKHTDDRPSVLGYSEDYEGLDMNYILVRLREVDGEAMRAVQNELEAAMPDKAVYVNSMKNEIAGLYNDDRIERNSIMMCSFITLLIVLLGLVGYLHNEIVRRSAEIAIRKINGAGIGDILRLLVKEILYISIPALVVGSLIAFYVAGRWLSSFSERIALSPWLFALSAASVLAVILAVSVAVSYRISIQNPVTSLKKDE